MNTLPIVHVDGYQETAPLTTNNCFVLSFSPKGPSRFTNRATSSGASATEWGGEAEEEGKERKEGEEDNIHCHSAAFKRSGNDYSQPTCHFNLLLLNNFDPRLQQKGQQLSETEIIDHSFLQKLVANTNCEPTFPSLTSTHSTALTLCLSLCIPQTEVPRMQHGLPTNHIHDLLAP